MACDKFQKDVGDTRRITGDWSGFLGNSAQISSASYAISPVTVPALTAANNSIAPNGRTETNFYSGGRLNAEYDIKSTITTDETPPRVKSFLVHLRVEPTC